jgi:NDP-sugar pyrophosphorylase family protein
MKINQALVTIGGTGSKLRRDGIEVPLSKSFLVLDGKPLFHWCLFGLFHAGITDLVVVAERKERLLQGEEALKRFPHSFLQVQFCQDPGLGTTGLPWHARQLLRDEFFFEYGHSISEPDHYREMARMKAGGGVVFSAYKPLSDALRPCVRIHGDRIVAKRSLSGDDREYVVGSPSLIDQAYVARLPICGFNSYRIFGEYLAEHRVKLVVSKLPAEIDCREEMVKTFPIYRRYIHQTTALGFPPDPTP